MSISSHMFPWLTSSLHSGLHPNSLALASPGTADLSASVLSPSSSHNVLITDDIIVSVCMHVCALCVHVCT